MDENLCSHYIFVKLQGLGLSVTSLPLRKLAIQPSQQIDLGSVFHIVCLYIRDVLKGRRCYLHIFNPEKKVVLVNNPKYQIPSDDEECQLCLT